jgi:hypothetical protein
MGTSPAALQYLVGYYEECERQTSRALGEQAFRAAYQRGMELALWPSAEGETAGTAGTRRRASAPRWWRPPGATGTPPRSGSVWPAGTAT